MYFDYKIHLLYEFYKVARRRPPTTIFTLIGPCEILSHGQKSVWLVTKNKTYFRYMNMSKKVQARCNNGWDLRRGAAHSHL